jgi:Flp pilus assembly protein TadB
MRASDADREHVTERLRQAAAEGRLLASELEERLARALRARTYGELDATIDDLPRTHVQKRSRTHELAHSHPLAAVALVGAATVVVVVVVAVMVAWFLMAWGLWLMIALVVMASRRSRSAHYPQHRSGLGARAHPGGDRWR